MTQRGGLVKEMAGRNTVGKRTYKLRQRSRRIGVLCVGTQGQPMLEGRQLVSDRAQDPDSAWTLLGGQQGGPATFRSSDPVQGDQSGSGQEAVRTWSRAGTTRGRRQRQSDMASGWLLGVVRGR